MDASAAMSKFDADGGQDRPRYGLRLRSSAIFPASGHGSGAFGGRGGPERLRLLVTPEGSHAVLTGD
jgi:hypothetical protein